MKKYSQSSVTSLAFVFVGLAIIISSSSSAPLDQLKDSVALKSLSEDIFDSEEKSVTKNNDRQLLAPEVSRRFAQKADSTETTEPPVEENSPRGDGWT